MWQHCKSWRVLAVRCCSAAQAACPFLKAQLFPAGGSLPAVRRRVYLTHGTSNSVVSMVPLTLLEALTLFDSGPDCWSCAGPATLYFVNASSKGGFHRRHCTEDDDIIWFWTGASARVPAQPFHMAMHPALLWGRHGAPTFFAGSVGRYYDYYCCCHMLSCACPVLRR